MRAFYIVYSSNSELTPDSAFADKINLIEFTRQIECLRCWAETISSHCRSDRAGFPDRTTEKLVITVSIGSRLLLIFRGIVNIP